MPYDAQDIRALLREHPHFVHGITVKGPNLTFREAVPDDAEFILSLRTDPALNKHLSPVANDVARQAEWIAEAASDYDQVYYVIEADKPVGTVRLYDQRGTSFSWGSWILKAAPPRAAVESTCMVYQLGMALGFVAAHFEVRKANEKVWQYHERWGAERIGESEQDIFYRIDKGVILAGLKRYNIPVSAD